ncbi:MAG: 23S rRNA (pseudouridine(1915)-N(3))-methyltransferase RlmH [Succiniclasticum sp.]|jgi:23S rRNA (pseudouridine1915-N3)-methyltransferase|nr:23S rRNA (pseudouridine(1915)-N(3))-methyltransferase RlmH [Acidaminococcaceae bacterium]MBQ2220515.1 23S rRNA (pseudouridine(1915)-N(3))-methyltransferase RlmH [Acidaminococcaceae bacterium]MEE3454963.1 23S rRNA (pseudouridine(1915)-N(3))-methyltransferase RlmH [Succiniclasticum sp.]
MKITIACVGKLKEKYLTAAMDEYVKRLQPFCKLEIISINEEKMPQEPSEAEREQVLEKETKRLLSIIPEHSYVILLDLQGKQITSPELAEKMDALAVQGVSHITFVIGGAFGYTDALRKKADFRWSFSKLTFTHQMIRVLLAEQIYRAFKISKGEKYHW